MLGPCDLIVDPSGLHLYVANQGSNSVSRMSIHQQDGAPNAESSTLSGVAPNALELQIAFD